MERQQTSPQVIGAFDPWTLSLTVTYQDHTAGLLLAEVAKLHDPPLAFENIVEDLELDVFVRCYKEDLYILDVQAISNVRSKMTKVPDLRATKAEFTSYIADKSRYVSITEQQGPLRHGETQLLARRRWYIKQTMQWDAERLCWRSKDGRPLIMKDLIWDTVISEMRQLDTHGQRLVWTRVKAKFDGIFGNFAQHSERVPYLATPPVTPTPAVSKDKEQTTFGIIVITSSRTSVCFITIREFDTRVNLKTSFYTSSK